MNITELTQDQINELKACYFYDVDNNYKYIHEIPNEVIFNHYNEINFVNDDFFCY